MVIEPRKQEHLKKLNKAPCIALELISALDWGKTLPENALHGFRCHGRPRNPKYLQMSLSAINCAIYVLLKLVVSVNIQFLRSRGHFTSTMYINTGKSKSNGDPSFP